MEEVLEQIKEEPEESDPSGTAIVLNSTAEFCRTLGDIPTYGLAGNRDEDPGILLVFFFFTQTIIFKFIINYN